MIAFRPEHPTADAAGIEALYDTTFGPGHFAKTAERLREYSRSIPSVSHVAEKAGMIVGVCRVWPVRVGASPALFYGPVAVAPAEQGNRLGLTVTRLALDAGREQNWPAAVLIGAPEYFGEIGFQSVPADRFLFPGPQDQGRIMARALAGDWAPLAGAVTAAPDLAGNTGLSDLHVATQSVGKASPEAPLRSLATVAG